MKSSVTLRVGDCRRVLTEVPDNTFDSVVTDPPYGLSFMGKHWDYDVPGVDAWAEILRVLKPGGHLLAFAGTRTQHRMAVNIEDAGFEIRDMIAWLYGQGFSKSMDVSKSIDRVAGAEREVVGRYQLPNGKEWNLQHDSAPGTFTASGRRTLDITAPATENAKRWQGWGTALKPAMEPITVARKPLCGTVAANVLDHGVGALNIDGCRIATAENLNGGGYATEGGRGKLPGDTDPEHGMFKPGKTAGRAFVQPPGRFPANVIHDGSPEVLEGFPNTRSGKPGVMRKGTNDGPAYGAESRPPGTPMTGFGDSGSASRFFYCAKANGKDRGEGNDHPTVKPTDLMRYLVRLVTPPGGLVLDPFMGSGSTGKAAVLEGFRFYGVDLDPHHVAIAAGRILPLLRSPA